MTITRDDVTLQGVVANTLITAANTTLDTILMDGARRIILSNLDVRGGTTGVLGNRGAEFDIRFSSVRNNSVRGVTAANHSTGTVDNCVLESNQDGVLAVNGGNLYITTSTIQNNTRNGAVASRNSFLRIGQDINGTLILKPVTITGNVNGGVSITEASVGNIVGGAVENNTSTSSLIFVGRASRASIGVGSNNLQAATIVRNGQGDGIHVTDSATAVIVNTTVTGTSNGIVVRNNASARIGIDENNALAGNSITGNRQIGIQVSEGSSADIGGNTISANGTSTTGNRYGIGVFGAAALLAGGNLIENNPASGIFAARGSNLFVGATFGAIPTGNTIRNNGSAFASTQTAGGILVYQGSTGDIRDATITGNNGNGVYAFLNSVAELRNTQVTTSAVAVANIDDANGGQGVSAGLRSTVRLRSGSNVSNNAAHGVLLFNGGTVDFRGAVFGEVISSANGNGGFGVRCNAPEDSRSGDLTGVGANTLGAQSAACTGF